MMSPISTAPPPHPPPRGRFCLFVCLFVLFCYSCWLFFYLFFLFAFLFLFILAGFAIAMLVCLLVFSCYSCWLFFSCFFLLTFDLEFVSQLLCCFWTCFGAAGPLRMPQPSEDWSASGDGRADLSPVEFKAEASFEGGEDVTGSLHLCVLTAQRSANFHCSRTAYSHGQSQPSVRTCCCKDLLIATAMV